MRLTVRILFCVAWVAMVPPARAQFLCSITAGANIDSGRAYYWYTALSCNDNRAVAAASVDSDGYYVAFLLSNDGGLTWRIRAAGPPDSTWSHQPIITDIDQIDSLNIIAFGDSDLLVRTTDGGSGWRRLESPTHYPLEDISFSSSSDGMLVAADTAHGTFVTTNGGVSWAPAPFTRSYGWQCHLDRSGVARVFIYGSGVIYSTTDNWTSFDSTAPIFLDTAVGHRFIYSRCAFGSGDTLYAYGGHYDSHVYPFPCIARTTNAGRTWTSVYADTSIWWHAGYVNSISEVSRDTIVAGLSNTLNYVLLSTDRGSTWRFDTLVSSDPEFVGMTNFGIGYNSSGQLVGAFSLHDAEVPTLVLGNPITLGVEAYERILVSTHIYPDPAKDFVHITSIAPGDKVTILDILGRRVASGEQSEDGALIVDLRGCPNGVYVVMLDHGGIQLPVGKFCVESQ